MRPGSFASDLIVVRFSGACADQKYMGARLTETISGKSLIPWDLGSTHHVKGGARREVSSAQQAMAHPSCGDRGLAMRRPGACIVKSSQAIRRLSAP